MGNSKLIGRTAYITDVQSVYYGEWGTIADYNEEVYFVAIANEYSSLPVFDRNQFYVPRKEALR